MTAPGVEADSGAAAAIQVEIVRELAALPALRADWERLWSQDGTADIFASFDWFANWWRHFGHGEQSDALMVHDGHGLFAVPGREWTMRVCVVRDAQGAPLAILPLAHVHGVFAGIPCRVLATPVNDQAPRAGFIASRFDAEVVAALCEALLAERDWQMLLLLGLPAAGARVAALVEGMAGRGVPVASRISWGSAYLRFAGTYEQFVAGGRKLHFRRSLVKAENGLKKLGDLTLEAFTGARAVEIGMELFLEIDAASWKSHSGESVALTPNLRTYYLDLCGRLGSAGRAEVWVLRVGGTPAAAFFCLHDGRARYTLKSSFRETFGGARSPTFVLLSRIIRQTWGSNATGIDFVGKVPFLDRWSNEEHIFEQALLCRDRLLYARIRAHNGLKRCANIVRDLPKRVRGRLRRLLNRVRAQSPIRMRPKSDIGTDGRGDDE